MSELALQLRCLQALADLGGDLPFAARRLHLPQPYVLALLREIEGRCAVGLRPPLEGEHVDLQRLHQAAKALRPS